MLLDPKIVAEFWVAQQAEETTPREKKLNSWVSDLMMTVFWDGGDADYAWQIVEAIHERDVHQEYIGMFAASLVEDILCYHGADVIERVEAKAKRDVKFAKVLGGVWQSDTPHDIWKRVEVARGNYSW